jgi:small subunit ribosomal protein S16
MAVKIRLTRKGKKKQPTYRVVVADSRSPRDGRYIEQIGRYDPRQEPSIVEIDNDRASYWISVGAQPSAAVQKLLEISGAAEARPIKIQDPKVLVVEEQEQVEAAEDDEAVAEAAAVAVAVEAADEADVEGQDDDESFLDKAKDAVAAAAEKVADVVGDATEAVDDMIEDAVEAVTGDDDDDEKTEESP